jgi:cystathionine beta-synthase
MLGQEVSRPGERPMQYYGDILEAIGDTPLIRLNRVTEGSRALVLCKAEFLNPGGSVKDRIGRNMIEAAEREGHLRHGGTVVESTSGNTGVGLALVAATKGYRLVFTMPDKMSQEKIRLLKAFNAEVVITPTAVDPGDPESYYSVAKRIAAERPGAFYVNQYFNEQNTLSHYRTTGPEIWRQTDGKITHLVVGMGTGGTISGAGKYLKEQNPGVRVIGVDPEGSILGDTFHGRRDAEARPYKVEGIGEDIIPGTLWFEYVDEVHTVSDRESFHMARRLARQEGLLVGGSSGSACTVAVKIAKQLPEEAVVVVVFPDRGERYLSKLHSDEWMKENEMIEYEALTAGEVLALKDPAIPRIVSVGSGNTVREALELMNRHGLSCIPVLEGGGSLGSLVEQRIVKDVVVDPGVLDTPVTIMMDEPLPEVPADCEIPRLARSLARNRNAVLVREEDVFLGILTIHDLIQYYAR